MCHGGHISQSDAGGVAQLLDLYNTTTLDKSVS